MTIDNTSLEVLAERVEGYRRVVDERFNAHQDMHNALKEAQTVYFESAERALVKASEATENRFKAVNEFRQALSDQTQSYATKDELIGFMRQSETDRAGLHNQVNDLRLAQQAFISRDVLDQTKSNFGTLHQSALDQIDAVKVLQARGIGIAVGAATAISTVSALITVIIRLSGH